MIKNLPISQVKDESTGTHFAMEPKKFALWLFIGSIVMIFAALTSAFIVRRGEGDWADVIIPSVFAVNTFIVLLSSVTMHWAYVSAKKDHLKTLKLALGLTAVLGVAFLVAQYFGWGRLLEAGIYFVKGPNGYFNPGGAFMYVFTGLHGFHLISGIIFLLIVLYSAFKFKVHSKSLSKIEMCATYWHFLGGLWVYLYLFLLFNN